MWNAEILKIRLFALLWPKSGLFMQKEDQFRSIFLKRSAIRPRSDKADLLTALDLKCLVKHVFVKYALLLMRWPMLCLDQRALRKWGLLICNLHSTLLVLSNEVSLVCAGCLHWMWALSTTSPAVSQTPGYSLSQMWVTDGDTILNLSCSLPLSCSFTSLSQVLFLCLSPVLLCLFPVLLCLT